MPGVLKGMCAVDKRIDVIDADAVFDPVRAQRRMQRRTQRWLDVLAPRAPEVQLDRPAWDDGEGGPERWSAARARALLLQARNARTEQEWLAALDALDAFDFGFSHQAVRAWGAVLAADAGWRRHPNNPTSELYSGENWSIPDDAPACRPYRLFLHRVTGEDARDLFAAIRGAESIGLRCWVANRTEGKFLVFEVQGEPQEENDNGF